jgi:hypothetical protein
MLSCGFTILIPSRTSKLPLRLNGCRRRLIFTIGDEEIVLHAASIKAFKVTCQHKPWAYQNTALWLEKAKARLDFFLANLHLQDDIQEDAKLFNVTSLVMLPIFLHNFLTVLFQSTLLAFDSL